MSLLSAKNVSKIYEVGESKIHALDGVSIIINKGDFWAIVGKSGSGKSTLMHIIGLLDTPTSGKVLLNNKEVSSLSENELAKIRNKEIGFVFQAFNLLPRTSSLENVMLPLQYSDIPGNEWKSKAIKMVKYICSRMATYSLV